MHAIPARTREHFSRTNRKGFRVNTSAIPNETIRRALNVRRSYIRASNRRETSTAAAIRTVADQYRISPAQVTAYLTVASRVKSERQHERASARNAHEFGAMMRQNEGTL